MNDLSQIKFGYSLPFVTLVSLFINSLGMTTAVFLLHSSAQASVARFSIVRTVGFGLPGPKICVVKLRISSSIRGSLETTCAI